MYRVEDKYNCTEQQFTLLQQRLETVLRPDSNEGGPEGYRIISLYFDDFADSCLQDTVDGVNIRNKYRIRIYNDSLDVIKLEVKTKRDSRIMKWSRRITCEQMDSLMRGECIEDDASGCPSARM